MKMQFKKLIVLLWIFLMVDYSSASSNNTDDHSFIFSEGFSEANFSLDGAASITPNGLLKLTMDEQQQKGHAFFPKRIPFRQSPAGNIFSFSTTFIFAIISPYAKLSGHGIVFFVSPTTNFSTANPSQFFGLFNPNNNGNSSNNIFAVELDTIQNSELHDIDDDHVGIDINGVISDLSHHAGYFDNLTGKFHNLSLYSGDPMQVWIDYDGGEMKLNVTLAPIQIPKPKRPLLSLVVNLSSILLDSMYVGFSSSTGTVMASHYILGWSFKMNGLRSEALNISTLPSLPTQATIEEKPKSLMTIWLPVAAVSLALLISMAVIVILIMVRKRRKKFEELVEDWEQQYGPQRLSYKALFKATKGFKDKQLLGTGGFGKVYKGTLHKSDTEVAVKRVSNESRQGMREFIAEIASLGRLRHRNIVQLLGYCRTKSELLLVYEYMPNGSLDKSLHCRDKPALKWSQRLHIIKGVASGLEYLHEDCEQVVIHRDIKTNNVLLDSELNGRLGDFGLARLYDHGIDFQTTHVVGTMGYLAPELARTGRATTLTDVFAFGIFILEVVCGKKPIEPKSQSLLVDWVVENWQKGTILDTRDPRLEEESYIVDDLELVLELGLLCSHPLPTLRPTMRQVVQYLNGDAPLPQLSFAFLSSRGFDEFVLSYPVSSSTPIRSGDDQFETLQKQAEDSVVYIC
ncbi:Non-specific serine/threonine protein kinase protein [Dioscorea alata]|uniref:Non-specific serine/threonine protein kinase protein n=1 Tax=Dioscorea alata TaxID=55571 RepID=A0ACB7VI14_DIOAL|nr:Non-specific serine/threonine protein kinase protein [Dioscorea alata]